jgi:predicted Zn finger-like uncharacterized protein
MITSCPHCHKDFVVDDAMSGRQARCPNCSRRFAVSPKGEPAPAGAEEAPAAADPPTAPTATPAAAGSIWREVASSREHVALGPVALPTGIGRLLLLAGFVLVLLSRGGDSVGMRGVAASAARLNDARAEFEDKWDRKESELGELSSEGLERRRALRDEKNKERRRLERDEWADLRSDARKAGSAYVIWSYWREWLFLVGTLALAVGLVVVGFGGCLPEKIACLLMLLVLTVSLYIGGLAWLGSAASTIGGGAKAVFR